MPKIKTNRGAAKRFRKTGTGKIRRNKRLYQPHPDQEDHQAQA